MRLYFDENVPVPLATALAEHGIDCLTTRDAGNRGLSDEEQLMFATQEQRSLVTFNCKDFLSLATRWQEVGRSHTGMILSKELPLPELIRRFRHLAIRCRDRNLRDIIIWLPVIR
jgi:predicted nuclease of predicted toxin-antitoxin system